MGWDALKWPVVGTRVQGRQGACQVFAIFFHQWPVENVGCLL